MKKELSEEVTRDNTGNNVGIEEIRKVADIWGDMTNKQKNKALKAITERIAITHNNVKIRFIF